MTQKNVVFKQDIDLERGFSWDESRKKLWVNLGNLIDNDYIQINPTTGKVTVNPAKFSTLEEKLRDLIEGHVSFINAELERIKGDNRLQDETHQRLAQELVNKFKELEGKGAKVYANSPITGNGTQALPLGLNLNTDDLTINSEGKLSLAYPAPVVITTLNGQQYKFGMHVFTGSICPGQNHYVAGFPTKAFSEGNTSPAATDISQIEPQSICSDFNGYYIHTRSELNQVITIDGRGTWMRTNDAGSDANGNLNDPNAWKEWVKVDNVNLTAEQFNNLVNQVNQLKNQVETLRTDTNTRLSTLELPCETPVVTKSGTIDGSENVILVNGDIHLPENIRVGKQLTLIRNVASAGIRVDGTLILKTRANNIEANKWVAFTAIKIANGWLLVGG